MTNDDITFVFALVADHPWQERYAGLYAGIWAPEIEATRFALRLLTDPEFEAAENAKFLAEYGVAPPAIPDADRAPRAERLARDLLALMAAADQGMLGPGSVNR